MKKSLIPILMVIFFSCGVSYSDEARKPAVAGAFYPEDKEILEKDIALFLDRAEKAAIKEKILALIVPHAGYVYSGQVAAYGYKQIQGRRINRAVIISNSHTAYFPGIAIDGSMAWQTPLGAIEVDKELASKLVNAGGKIQYNSAVHEQDHTIEVQIPFLQMAIAGDFKIVPVLFGNTYDDSYKRLAQLLYDNLGDDDIIIISTDMSHYPAYEDANRIDPGTIEIIKEGDVAELERYMDEVKGRNVAGEETLLCGRDGVKALMELYNILGNARIESLKYANSGDVEIGDKSRVVGYSSLVLYVPEGLETREDTIMADEYLNKEEKRKLMQIARDSITEAVTGKREGEIDVTEKRLKENGGAFVTIKKYGRLRGCIGNLQGEQPLYLTVRDMARAAALHDPRFPAVGPAELEDIDIEISALSPLRRVESADEIKLGVHGVVVRKGLNNGVYLPQVATETGWSKEEFLSSLCADKAGLSPLAWKDKSTEIYIFSAEVFGEEDVQ